MTLNVIHLPNDPLLPHREKRELSFKKQFSEQGITDYKVWDGIIDKQLPFRGICRAFKRIIAHAKMMGLKQVIIAEDDILFTGIGAWDYFINNIPNDYSIFLGGIYNLNGQGGTLDKDNRVIDFYCGNTLMVVNENFYDLFINLREFNHCDREISKYAHTHKIIVCDPFVVRQANGYSDQKRRECNYDDMLIGRRLFGVNS